MISLTSTSSSAKGLHEYINRVKGSDNKYANAVFAQGDVINTIIKCAGGQTISLTLDTTLPRTYSRGFTVRGTKAAYFEDNDSVFIDGEHNEYEFKGKELWGNAEKYEAENLHPLWDGFVPVGGHDGMDEMVFRAFVDSAIAGVQPPIDVYDAAAYMVISALSEESIACGSQPVAIPDFTCGKWINRTDIVKSKYSLD